MTTPEQYSRSEELITSHIRDVQDNIGTIIAVLRFRGLNHDRSKLSGIEKEAFAATEGELSKTEYGSEAYLELLKKVKPAIDHHYSKNRHHPEHWPNGIDDMNLVDMIEIICDWVAATKKNKNGNIHRSIEINAARFNMSPQLARIFTNTVKEIFPE